MNQNEVPRELTDMLLNGATLAEILTRYDEIKLAAVENYSRRAYPTQQPPTAATSRDQQPPEQPRTPS